MRGKNRCVMAVSVALALVAAACGSDDNSGGGAATTAAAAPTTTAAAAETTTAAASETTAAATETTGAATESSAPAQLSGDPVKVFALITPATADNTRAGLQLGEKMINATGGIQGRPVKLTICEDKQDPNVAAQCARDAIADGAIAEVDRTTSYGATVNPVLTEAGVPTIGGGVYSAADFAATNLYPFSMGIMSTIGSAVAGVKLGMPKIGVPYIDVPAGAALAPTIEPLITPLGGSVVGVIPVPATVADVTSYVAAEIQADPDLVVDGLVLNTYSAFIQETRKQGGTFPFMVSSGLGDAKELQDAIGDMTGVIINSASNYDSKGYADFLADYEKYSDFPTHGDNILWGWQSFKLLQEVGNKATELTPKGLTDAIQTITAWDSGDINPPIDFSKPGNFLGGKAPSLRNDTQWFYEVKDGKYVAYKDGQPVQTLS